MSDLPAQFDLVFAELDQVEARIDAIRLMIEFNINQENHLHQANVAFAAMSESQRAKFCREHHLVEKDPK